MKKLDRQKAHNSRGRFEQWTRNPTCKANLISAVYGYGMDEISVSEGGRVTKGQSPFAIARGKIFERSLFNNQAERLIQELKVFKEIPENGDIEFHDFRLRSELGPFGNIDLALKATRDFLDQTSKVKPAGKYYLLAGPVVVIPGSKVMLPEAMLIIDALLIKPMKNGYEAFVGEIKTYPDRSGFTEPSDLSTARAQAGIYVHALRLVLEDLNLSSVFRVSNMGFLVLSKPGSNYPSLRLGEDLTYMAERAERGFDRLRNIADSLKPQSSEELLKSIQNAETDYREDCLSFCDRASHCLSVLEKEGKPVLLGQEMQRLLGDACRESAL